MKKIYRNGLTATALIMAALLPASCSQNDEPASPTGNVVQVELSAQIGSEKAGKANSRALTRVANNQWELNDMVGMYMIEDGGSFTIVSGYENKRYRVVEGPGSTGFKLTAATQADAMYYPEDESAVDFIAYYPYRSTITNYKYPLDVQIQDGSVNLDLLYSTDGTGSSTSSTGNITFEHQMSKLVVKLKPLKEGLIFSSMVGKITGVPITGDFNLADGKIYDTTDGDIVITDNYQAGSGDFWDEEEGGEGEEESKTEIMCTCFDFVLIPHDPVDRTLNFSTATKNYRWTLPVDLKFEKGKVYTVTLGIDGDNMLFSSIMINSWGEGAETLSIPMVKVTGGDFMMGSPVGGTEITFGENPFTPDADTDAADDEKPMHKVTISNFYMSKYTITNAEYCLFLNEAGITGNTAEVEDFGSQTLFNAVSIVYADGKWSSSKGNYPMVNVTWFGAKAFADWAGGSLPTEAQWEYACRGKDYFFGNAAYRWASFNNTALADYAWYDYNSGAATHEVGLKQPNEYGLYDMHGNVWEWCADYYDAAYYAEATATDPDPVNTTVATNRVRRGGAFDSSDLNCRSAARGSDAPETATAKIGFRVVFKN